MTIDATPGEPLVELVDEAGRAVGSLGKLAAHREPGSFHRAISVFLIDADGRLILQRRAAGKYHSGGLWSNTCCGHPAPGETPEAAARRRLADELDLVVDAGGLREAGIAIYAVDDEESGLVEREYNHVFVGRASAAPVPNPAEVDEVTTLDLEEALSPARDWDGFSAWFPFVLETARPALADMAEEAAQAEAASRS
jgi:isopentenyl-diphosphate delta-isomerase